MAIAENISLTSIHYLARPEGFEPPTPRFVVWCSQARPLMKTGVLFPLLLFLVVVFIFRYMVRNAGGPSGTLGRSRGRTIFIPYGGPTWGPSSGWGGGSSWGGSSGGGFSGGGGSSGGGGASGSW